MSTVNNMQIQDDEGNVFHPETSIEQIVGENGTQVFPGGKPCLLYTSPSPRDTR